MKKLLLMMCVILIPFKGLADEKTPIVVYDSGTRTLSFLYGVFTSNGYLQGQYGEHVSIGWDLNSCNFGPRSVDFKKSDVRKVVFSPFSSSYKPIDLSGFFEGLSSLTEIEGLERLNTSEATNMSRMFAGCSSLTSLDLTSFDASKATDLSGMFNGCTNLKTIYCNDTWADGHSDVFTGCVNLVGGDGTTYSEDRTSSAYAHPNSGGYFTGEGDTYFGPYSFVNPAAGTLTFEYGELTDEKLDELFNQGINVICHAWSVDEDERSNITKAVFAPSCSNYYPTDLSYLFYNLVNLTSIDGLEYLNTSKVTNMKAMFSGCSSLTSLDVSKLNTSNVTDMSSLFYNCSTLSTLDVSHFNTSNVTNMNLMFYGCSSLTSLDVSSLNTSNVTDMGGMFWECSALTSLDVSHFNTSNVTNTELMFCDCSSLTSLDLSNFNTSKVESMYAMFYGCNNLSSLNVSNFNTSNVESMYLMFLGCSALNSLDVSNFDTSNVQDINEMFSGCSGLTSLDVSNFDTNNVTDMGGLFYGCSGLTNLDVSNFNTSNVTGMSYMFSGCSTLTTLDISNFDTSKATDLNQMFSGCSNLETIYCNDTWAEGHEAMFEGCEKIKGGHGTTYSAENTSSAYAHPNSGGYFTGKRTTFSTVTIGTSVQYWSSFYTTTRNVRADNFTTVYTATLSSDGKELTLNEIADKIIPCGQAVLMRSTEKEPMFVTADSEGTGDYSTNSLQGTQVDIPTSSIEGTVYTLANESTEFGFFKYTGETLKGGKAFLVVPGGALARITIAGLDSDATGIERIGSDDSQTPYYDLQGRRVSQPQKGIYVVNGKKVVK